MNEFIEFLPVTKWPLNFEEAIFCRGVFDKCDREKDYETAWAEFERRKGKGGL